MAEMRRVTSAGGVLLAIEAVLRPEVWAEQTPTLHPEVSTLRRVVHAALLEGARRTGVGCWDAADRLGALAAEAGWVDCVLGRDVLELAAPTETGAASELRSALLEQWSADADEAEWETLRALIEASGEPVEPFERLRALELPQRARELVELRRGRLPGPIRRAYVTAVGRPGGVSSAAS